jgi:hypothetical protein
MGSHLARVLCLVGVTAGFLAGLAPATFAVEAKRDRVGDLRAPGTTPAERRALDITSVRAVGGPEFGLMVTVTFARNLERRIGRGGLRRTLVALVVRPKSRRARPAGIVSDRKGHYGRIRRRTGSDAVYVRRQGRRFTFFLLGPGLQNVRSIVVGAFRAPPRRNGGKRGRASQVLTEGFLGAILDAIQDRDPAYDLAVVDIDEAGGYIYGLPCPTLRKDLASAEAEEVALTSEIARARADGRKAAVKRLTGLRRDVRQRIQGLRDEIAKRCGQTRQPGGPERTCAFGFSKTSPQYFLITWRCDQAHRLVKFNFNADIASIDKSAGNVSSSCLIITGNPREIECNGDFQAGETYVFIIKTVGDPSCPAFYFDPTVDGRALPQVACSG